MRVNLKQKPFKRFQTLEDFDRFFEAGYKQRYKRFILHKF